MKVLIFGNDSCTHVLAWKLVNSMDVQEVILAPGNGGTSFFASSIDLAVDDLAGITNFAVSEMVDLIIVDAPGMAAGIPDELGALPLPVVGSGSRLKPLHFRRCAGREWLQQHGLPTLRGRVCTTQQQAEKYAVTLTLPIAIVADDPAEPAIVCTDRTAVPQAIADCLEGGLSAGVIVEEVVNGPLVTASLLTDGSTAIAIPATRLYPATSQPYARLAGVHSAATPLWSRLEAYLEQQVRQPLLAALRADSHDGQGWIGTTCVIGQRGPLVQSLHLVPSGLEVAATLPRLTSDLLPLLQGCARRTLASAQAPTWSSEAVVGVALSRSSTTGGGTEIPFSAFETFDPGILVFHHATTPLIPNAYIPRAARFGPSRPSTFGSGSLATSLYSGTAADTIVAIVVTSGPDVATAHERLYTNIRRSGLAPHVYRQDVGSREL